MSKTGATQKKITSKYPKHVTFDKNNKIVDGDIPPPKTASGPVPPPSFTLEQLLANIPEPDFSELKSKSSQEVDTGKPVGKEVW